MQVIAAGAAAMFAAITAVLFDHCLRFCPDAEASKVAP